MTTTAIRFLVSTTTVTVSEPTVMSLAYATHIPYFCKNACITSPFPRFWPLSVWCYWVVIPSLVALIGVAIKMFAAPRVKAITTLPHREPIKQQSSKDEKVKLIASPEQRTEVSLLKKK